MVNDDIESIQLEIGKYEKTLSKVIQCYDNPNCNFHYTKEQLADLIKNLDKYSQQLSNIWMKKVSQD